MTTKVSLGTALLVALIAVVAAIFVYRTWFGPSGSAIDRENAALMARLAQSQEARDSLQAVIVSLQQSLDALQAAERVLEGDIDSLNGTLAARETRIRMLQQTMTTYDLPPDSLVRALNRVLARLYADSSANAP